MSKDIVRKVKRVFQAVQAEHRAQYEGASHVARGLSSEGYVGGYLQALSDVSLALNGVHPNTSRFARYWRDDE